MQSVSLGLSKLCTERGIVTDYEDEDDDE